MTRRSPALDALKRQADAQRAAIALAKTNAEQVAVRRSQVQTNQHMQEAAAAQQAKADVRLGYTEVKSPMTASSMCARRVSAKS